MARLLKSTSMNVRPDRVQANDIPNIQANKGEVIWDENNSVLKVYNGTAWVALEASTFVAPHGWGYYIEDQTVASTQVLTTTPQKLTIDGLGSTSSSDYLPLEIRGISELWDTATNKITPINIGDDYILRIDMGVTAKTGSPTELKVELDIGGGATPSIVIVERFISTAKAPPYNFSVAFPIFCLGTFIANGGQLFLSTNAGTLTIKERGISIHRIGSNS